MNFPKNLTCSLALLITIALGASGCSNLTPVENALIAAGVAGAATGVALGTTGNSAGLTIPVALGAAVLAGAGTYVYAKHRATIDQRRIAEARARLYYAQLDQQQQQHTQHYLAVNAPNTSKTQGQNVMLYDTRTRKIANDIYDLKAVPKVGQTTSLGNTAATYVGSGY